jgi:peroxiredoxin
VSKRRPKGSATIEAAAVAASAPTESLPRPLVFLAAGLCGLAGLLLLGLFVRAIPDAAQRGKLGLHRAAEGACEALRPEPVNAVLGQLPVPAPDFRLKDYAGREVRLADLKGSVVLVNFWATWCNTCVVEMPSMERLVSRMSGKPFRLLAISVDEEWAPIRKFFDKGTPLEILLDKERTVPKAYGTDKFPGSFLIDKDGTLRYYIVSNRDWSTGDVASCIEALLD